MIIPSIRYLQLVLIASLFLKVKADSDWKTDVAVGASIDICDQYEGCRQVMAFVTLFVAIVLFVTLIFGIWSLADIDWSDFLGSMGWATVGYASSRAARRAFR